MYRPLVCTGSIRDIYGVDTGYIRGTLLRFHIKGACNYPLRDRPVQAPHEFNVRSLIVILRWGKKITLKDGS